MTSAQGPGRHSTGPAGFIKPRTVGFAQEDANARIILKMSKETKRKLADRGQTVGKIRVTYTPIFGSPGISKWTVKLHPGRAR